MQARACGSGFRVRPTRARRNDKDRSEMSSTEPEIAVDDPTAPSEDSPAVTSTRTVETIVYALLIPLALWMAFDNWRQGMGWEGEGRRPAYFPFNLSAFLGVPGH